MKIIHADEKFKLDNAVPHGSSKRPSEATSKVRSADLEPIADLLRENQKLIAMGRLAASIAHEINNPLESVTNLLFLMEQEPDLSENVRSSLALAQRELGRAVQISKQTLNFYRETSVPAAMHVEDLLEEVLVLYRRRIEDKQLQVRHQYEYGMPAKIFPGEMRQVLSNLIANAIEACPQRGRLWLRLRAAHKWDNGGLKGLRITIADNGYGIDPSTRRQLGMPFFTTKGHQGTGLGLWVTLSILHRQGGRLQSYSSVHPERHGTAFSVFLPSSLRPQAVIRDPPAKMPSLPSEEESPLEEAG